MRTTRSSIRKVTFRDVQERLGHEDISTTLQTYAHNTEELLNRFVATFEKAVGVKTPAASTR